MDILTFKEIGKDHARLVGGKAASLAFMLKSGINVPDGFVITTEAYRSYNAKEMPADLIGKIQAAFTSLGAERVAVRSSAIAEDSGAASWAGQLESYLNVTSETLIENIKKCWRSIDSPRAKQYAATTGAKPEDLAVAVVIQSMVASEESGVMFTVDPVSNNRNHVMIEGSYGLGEMVVQGEVMPDHFTVDRKSGEILERQIGAKEQKLVFEAGKNTLKPTSLAERGKLCLEDSQVAKLKDIGLKLESLYGKPQDVEWAIADGTIYIVQARPITTLSADATHIGTIDGKILAEGLGASHGLATGPVRLIESVDEVEQAQAGEVLVAKMTSPDFIEAFNKVVGVVTDSGGSASHAAIVSRELNIPAVVGTTDATQKLKNGQLVTVDGYNGKIYEGAVELEHQKGSISLADLVIKSSGNDIDDLISSMSNDELDTREIWPLPFIQADPYFDMEQALDLYEKLKILIGQGWSFHKIAALFERPEPVHYFLLNVGIASLKTAHELNIGNITTKEQIEFSEWLIAILKELNPEDPLLLEGKNIHLTKYEVDSLIQTADFQTNKDFLHSVNRLMINLFTLNWSFCGDYYGAASASMHGPYQLGGTKTLLVREYSQLPTEIWPLSAEVPFKHIKVSQVFEDVRIFINFAFRIGNKESITSHILKTAVEVDGKYLTTTHEIETMSKQLVLLAKQQTEYVGQMDKFDIVRKLAMLAYYSHKQFYLHFDKQWYPSERIEASIKVIGRKFIDMEPSKTSRTKDQRRAMIDPRNYTSG